MRVWLSVSLCIIAVGVVSVANHQIMSDTAALPRQIYDQPYRVGLAVRDLKADVAIMHSELTDLAEAPSRLGLRRFEKRMEEIDGHIHVLRQAIATRFHGDAVLVQDAFVGLEAWNGVREQVVTAIGNGDNVTAYTLTKTEGYNQVKVVDEALQRLVEAANDHSKALYEDASDYLYMSRIQSAGAVLIAFLFLGGAAFTINRILVRPVLEISEAMTGIANGNLSTTIPHDERPDEIGLIARSSKVFLNHVIAIQESSIDLLTGLPNRIQMTAHIERVKARTRPADFSGFLLHVDIDGFVDLNDSLGRDAGDQLLKQAANRLRALLSDGDFVAREGPDSFVWFHLGQYTEAGALQFAERLQRLLEKPVQIDGQDLVMECSIGIAASEPGLPTEKFLVQAENAFIETRRQSGRSISVYTEEMDARLVRRRETLRGLRFALRHDEITPFFQPQVSARTGELCGFESLVRWNHPEHGILAPWQFLSIAQSAGLMGAITEIMISKSLAQLAEWRSQGFDVPRISLNLTASDLGREGFADRLMLEIERHSLNPDDVCLELLESAMIEDSDDPVSRTLNRLGQLGFPIELDDFGTGHAAIASLRLIALNGIKIDRSFVTKLHERPGQVKLTRAMLRLAHALQIKSVAEGVESVHERKLLLELGCDVLQGFGIGRPMSGSAASLWLEEFTPAMGRMLDVRQSA